MTFRNRGGAVQGLSLVIFVSLYGIVFVKADNSYEFGKDCVVLLETVSMNNEIYVTYDGKSVGSYCDDFSFQSMWSENSVSYQICVTPLSFEDPDCAVRLKYKKSYGGSTLQTITCDSESSNKTYCGDSDDDLYVFFEKRGQLSTSNAKFKLRVYLKEYDASGLVWAVIGGVIGSIICITLIIALVCWCVCRRRPAQGRVLTPNQTATTVSQPAYPQAAYSTPQNGNPNVGLYPVGNYGTAYPPASTTAQPQYQQSPYSPAYQPPLQQTVPSSEFPEKQPSAPPPPSYDETVKQ